MSQVEQKRRELFEAWFKVEFPAVEVRAQNLLGTYTRQQVELSWIGFNAALDAVVIELPESWIPIDAQERGWEMMGKFRAAIEAAGIKVKP